MVCMTLLITFRKINTLKFFNTNKMIIFAYNK